MNVAVNPEFQLRIRRDEPMSKHTSWRVGGPADVFFTPHDRAELATFLRALPAETPVMWVGLGSNLLVRDGGIRGVVICTHGAFTRLERRAQLRVYCES
ncbi:MAG: UDP-N-acetylenolpyruvoylglucosamine reductase, partial [Proteobacteria bacterium]|nr:UDP-N-acetylenolpyruvoylglucosamine reductase [Pseudomonadota bacterium]